MEITFDHLKVFRRCLFEAYTGTLEFHTSLGTVWLHMSDGYFFSESGNKAIIKSVQSVLKKPVHACFRRSLMYKGDKGVHASAEVLLDACYTDELSSIQTRNFAKHFCCFPPVIIKLAPMHRHGSQFPGFEEYVKLYEKSVFEGGISLKRELRNIESLHDLLAMVRLLIILYLLGLMEPSKVKVEEKPTIFSKLMKRIRNL